MILVVTSQANRQFAEKHIEGQGAQFISPTHSRAVHGAEKVIIVGIHPKIERRYQGICPIEVIEPERRPRREIIEPAG